MTKNLGKAVMKRSQLKAFWKTIRPFLSDKGTNINKIAFEDNDEVISEDKQLCKVLSKLFLRDSEDFRCL